MVRVDRRLLSACLVVSLIVTGLGARPKSAQALTSFDQASYAQSSPPLAQSAGKAGDDCGRAGACPEAFLKVVTRRGNAEVSIVTSCNGDWRHVWRRRNAPLTLRQWHDRAVGKASGSLCIPLDPRVNEIRVDSAGGHCGFDGGGLFTFSNAPGEGGTLRRDEAGRSPLHLEGCHAGTGNPDFGMVAYGGIALDFSDGYEFGDAYAAGAFYGVYEAFETSPKTPIGFAIYAISKFNTYHYRVELLVDGSSDGQRPAMGEGAQ